jgi:lysine-specific demethylase 8
MQAVERVERPAVARFRRDYLRPRRPVLLVGTNDHWRARHWTAEQLVERLGDCPVRPGVLDDGHVKVDAYQGVAFETMDFRTYVDQLDQASPPRYYLRLLLTGEQDSLRQDFDTPPYCLANVAMKVSLWVGAPGTITDIHYDMFHNFAAQLSGTRRVTLFSPEFTERLYPYPMRTLNWHHSRVRMDALDVEAFPRFRDAEALTVDLAPGEMLFIPRGWWHHFQTLERSVALNFFWATPALLPPLVISKLLWMLRRVQT